MPVKLKQQVPDKGKVGIADYILFAYWIFFAVIIFITDLLIDLYTDNDYANVFWISAIIGLPLAAYTLYIGRQTFLTSWYAYILSPLFIYGLYLGSVYFTTLNLDLLFSALLKPETEQVLPVEKLDRVIARKAGFIHTNVTLRYNGSPVIFQGTRTSYFLLKPHKSLHVKIGRSYLGGYYVTQIQVPAKQRWLARWAYLKDWFSRYYWLLIGLPLILFFSFLKGKYFPAPVVNVKTVKNKGPYLKFFKLLFIILLIAFGLFMLIVLLVGLFG